MNSLLLSACLILGLAVGAVFALILQRRSQRKPTLEADWSDDQVRLPVVEQSGDHFLIRHIRDCEYRSIKDYDVRYFNHEYSLKSLKRVWLVVDHFRSNWLGPAHTLLSFEFEGPEYLTISVEIRRKQRQGWSAWRGVLNEFEIMYVLATEEDSIALRTNARQHAVYLYPVAAERERVRDLFCDIMTRVDELSRTPEFYNTITNNCNNNLLWHVRRIAELDFPRSIIEILPGYSDKYAYRLGMLDQSVPFPILKSQHFISECARAVQHRSDFSTQIRSQILV